VDSTERRRDGTGGGGIQNTEQEDKLASAETKGVGLKIETSYVKGQGKWRR